MISPLRTGGESAIINMSIAYKLEVIYTHEILLSLMTFDSDMWPSFLVDQVVRVVFHDRLYLKMVEFPADETLDIEDTIHAFSGSRRKHLISYRLTCFGGEKVFGLLLVLRSSNCWSPKTHNRG
jgi:hypothetical protein